jgi:hypothetical protein
METFFTFEYDGDMFDLECINRVDAERYADTWWEDDVLSNHSPISNGETFEDYGFIIEFYFNEDGDSVEIGRDKYPLYYEYYHGDFVEHNVWWGV